MSKILDHWISGIGLPDVLVIDGHIHMQWLLFRTLVINCEIAASRFETNQFPEL